MTLALWLPPLPPLPLHECTNKERRITGKCWDLAGIQTALAENRLTVMLSPSAQATMRDELFWAPADLVGYIHCLTPARYVSSEWGLPAGHAGRVSPMAADAYCMGYHRINGVENQRAYPWAYVKFALRPNVGALVVLSAHQERKL